MFSEYYAEQVEQAAAIMEYEIYGISFGLIALAILLFMFVSFILSGPRDRGIIGRSFDLIVVLASIALLVVCVAGGTFVGHSYDMTAIGSFAGVMLFAGIFYVLFSIRTAKKNAEERTKLANFLKSKNRKR